MRSQASEGGCFILFHLPRSLPSQSHHPVVPRGHPQAVADTSPAGVQEEPTGRDIQRHRRIPVTSPVQAIDSRELQYTKENVLSDTQSVRSWTTSSVLSVCAKSQVALCCQFSTTLIFYLELAPCALCHAFQADQPCKMQAGIFSRKGWDRSLLQEGSGHRRTSSQGGCAI